MHEVEALSSEVKVWRFEGRSLEVRRSEFGAGGQRSGSGGRSFGVRSFGAED